MIRFPFLVFILIIFYFLNFFSLLNSLLLLESFSLIIFSSLFFYMSFYFSLKVVLFYFVFVVCERAIGLSILVSSIKYYGLSNFIRINLTTF